MARHTDLTYDGLGRPLTTRVYLGSGTGTLKQTTTTVYNGDGTVATVSFDGTGDGEGTDEIDFTYDAMSRPEAVIQDDTVVVTDYAWNADNTLASRADGSAGTSSFTYDWADRLATATSPLYTGSATFGWRLDGLLGTRLLPGDSNVGTFTYDGAKRVTDFSKGGTVSLALGQTYDRAGNVTADDRTFAGVSGVAGGGTFEYTYDGLSRITGADLDGISQSYAYDLDGNRTTKVDDGVTTTYTYDRTDQLIEQVIAGDDSDFTYDAYGNVTRAADEANALTTYIYDTADRLTSIDPPAEAATSFTFDALGRHATRVTPAGTDSYGYVGASETVWQVANAGLTVNSAIDAAGNRNGVKPGSTVGLTVADLHGSVAAELSQNGASILSALRYDPWGLVPSGGAWDSGGSFTNPWRYQGRLDVSPVAGDQLYDYGARFYAPAAGVFTQLDTYTGQALDPRSMNRYLYALANPATLIDPSGHKAEETTNGTGAPPPPTPTKADTWWTDSVTTPSAADSWEVEAARATAQSGMAVLVSAQGARKFASMQARCLKTCVDAFAKSDAGRLLPSAGAATKWGKSALFRALSKLALPLGIAVDYLVGRSEGQTVGEAGFRAGAAGVGGILGAAAGTLVCGGLAFGSGGVGALACGAIIGGAATGFAWGFGEVAGFAYDSFGAVHDFVDDAGEAVGGAVSSAVDAVGGAASSAFDAITFWDNG